MATHITFESAGEIAKLGEPRIKIQKKNKRAYKKDKKQRSSEVFVLGDGGKAEKKRKREIGAIDASAPFNDSLMGYAGDVDENVESKRVKKRKKEKKLETIDVNEVC